MASPPRAPLPALRPGVAVIPMDGAVQLRVGDEEVHVLRTEAPEQLLRLLAALDGARGAESAPRSADEAHALDDLVAQLESVGLLAAARPGEGLAATRVVVVGHAPSAALLAAVLTAHGLAASVRERGLGGPDDGAPAALVCVCEAPDLTLQLAINDAACAAQTPCLFVDLSHGRHATVGPFYLPADGACYRCFRARLRENTAAFAELRAAEEQMLATGRPLPAGECWPAHRHLVAGLAAGEIVAFVTRQHPLRTLNRAITVALFQAEMWSEPVWRVPWCEACGERAARQSG
jgi:bacteriocin biosynthesis cyclodehydratase domain-containing protein